MMKLTTILCFLLVTIGLYAQGEGYKVPQYNNGQTSLQDFIQQNLSMPANAKDGIVRCQFTISETGNVSAVEIISDIDGCCGEEAKRVIRLTDGQWKAATIDGKATEAAILLPINFYAGMQKSTTPPGDFYNDVLKEDVIFQSGRANLDKGKTKKAIKELKEAVLRNPNAGDALYYLGLAQMSKNKLSDACKSFKKIENKSLPCNMDFSKELAKCS